jgi:hypothetical protein
MSLEAPTPGQPSPSELKAPTGTPKRRSLWRHGGTIPIGAMTGGLLGGAIGLQNTIWVGAVGSFIGFLPVLFSQVRTLDRIPEAAI